VGSLVRCAIFSGMGAPAWGAVHQEAVVVRMRHLGGLARADANGGGDQDEGRRNDGTWLQGCPVP
jgi:hypothetical protein